MNIHSHVSFTMVERDEDTGTTVAVVSRDVTGETLDDLAQSFLYFLWNMGFNYVEEVVIRTGTGKEISAS